MWGVGELCGMYSERHEVKILWEVNMTGACWCINYRKLVVVVRLLIWATGSAGGAVAVSVTHSSWWWLKDNLHLRRHSLLRVNLNTQADTALDSVWLTLSRISLSPNEKKKRCKVIQLQLSVHLWVHCKQTLLITNLAFTKTKQQQKKAPPSLDLQEWDLMHFLFYILFYIQPHYFWYLIQMYRCACLCISIVLM